MKLRQMVVSEAVKFFARGLNERWGLEPTDTPDTNKPCVYVGAYDEQRERDIAEHKAPVIVMATGRDCAMPHLARAVQARYSEGLVTYVPRYNNESRSAQYWKSAGVKSKLANISFSDYPSLKVVPKGHKVYCYLGASPAKRWRDECGQMYMEAVAAKIGWHHFIWADTFMPIEYLVAGMYTQAACFLKTSGFRANTTMYEMAHMGRRTIGYYSDTEYAQPIVKHARSVRAAAMMVEEELDNAGTVDEEIRAEAERTLIDERWLDLDWWESSEESS